MLLHHVWAGDEGPVIVGIPGGPGFDHELIRPALDQFTDAARVVYVDPRNTGGSPSAPVETCTLEQTADDVAETCAALGLRDVVVFGHSAGGFYALHLALRHPHLVTGLVLCETGATLAPVADSRAPSLLERAGPEAAAVAGRVFAGDSSPETLMAFAQQVAPFYAGPTHMDVPIGIFSRSRFNGEIAQYFFSTLGPRYDLRPRLGEISVPTLVTVGAWDWVVDPSRGHELRAGIPGAELVEFAESGHFPFAEEPARWRTAMREYLGGLARS